MSNKQAATEFLRLAATGHVREAYDNYVHADFRHHNAYFPGDREALMKGMEESAENLPNKEYDSLRVLEDGDLVAVHGRIRLQPGLPDMAVVHILRFADGKIIEEWEAVQQVPEDCPNENGVF